METRIRELADRIEGLKAVVDDLVQERERCWQAWERHLAIHSHAAALLADIADSPDQIEHH